MNGTMGPDTIELLRMFNPCAPCKEHKRYGEPHDGGYVMCHDALVSGTPPIAAYSYGIRGFDKWSEDIAKEFNVPVYQYDCFNQEIPSCVSASGSTCDQHFKPECLATNGAPPTTNFRTLAEQFSNNRHNTAPDRSLIVKIDIEGAEWDFFAAEPHSTLKKIKQLVVEFHNIQSTHSHPAMLMAMRNLHSAGLRIQHIHSTNSRTSHIHFFDGKHEYQFPTAMEVSFVWVGDMQTIGGTCDGEQYPYTVELDARNWPKWSEMEPPILPPMTSLER